MAAEDRAGASCLSFVSVAFPSCGEQSLSLLGGVCVCVCVMWESFLSLCLPPEGLPPSFEAPVAMTQQESQTCSSAAAEPPITTPPPRTPGSLPSFPSLGHPHEDQRQGSLTPSQRQGARAQSGWQGGLKAQPPLLRGGLTFPGSGTLETGQSQGPWRSGARGGEAAGGGSSQRRPQPSGSE